MQYQISEEEMSGRAPILDDGDDGLINSAVHSVSLVIDYTALMIDSALISKKKSEWWLSMIGAEWGQ